VSHGVVVGLDSVRPAADPEDEVDLGVVSARDVGGGTTPKVCELLEAAEEDLRCSAATDTRVRAIAVLSPSC